MGWRYRSRRTSGTARQLRFEQLDRRELLAAFAPTSLVVTRVGDGVRPLDTSATAVFLDEYLSESADQQTPQSTTPLPAVDEGSRFTLSGSTILEGFVTRSADERYLVLGGYDAMLETTSVSLRENVRRIVARVDVNQDVDVTTSIGDGFLQRSIRSVVSADGISFWMAGQGVNDSGGVRYVPLGGVTSTRLSGDVNTTRSVAIFRDQLYVSTESSSLRVATVGSGTPITAGQTMAALPGVNPASANQYHLADLSSAVPGLDTLYLANDSGAGAIEKWSLGGSGSWSLTSRLLVAGARGLTARVQNGNVQVVFTSENGVRLKSFHDSAGYGQSFGTVDVATLATAPGNTAFRGVAFAPSIPPSDFTLSTSTIAENNAAPSTIGRLTTTDANNDRHRYSLVAGDGDLENDSFFIVGDELRTTAAFDYETKASYSIRIRTTDTDGKFVEKSLSISVSDVNEQPTLNAASLGDTYTENQDPVRIASSAAIFDPEGDFAGGWLKATIAENVVPSRDILAIAAGDSRISRSGDTIYYDGQPIGIIDEINDGLSGRPLQVQFGTGVSWDMVEAVARSLTFQATGDNPATLPRTIELTVSDGQWNSEAVSVSIAVAAINDRPSLVLSGEREYLENRGLLRVIAMPSVADADDLHLAGGSLTVSMGSGGESTDVLAVRPLGAITRDPATSKVFFNSQEIGTFAGGSKLTPLVVQSTSAAATPAAVKALIQAIGFRSTSQNPTSGNHVVQFVLNDGDADSVVRSGTMRVIEVNDAPVINAASGTVSYTRKNSPVQLLSDATLLEDKPDFNLGKLTVTKSGGQTGDRLYAQWNGFSIDAAGKIYYGSTSTGLWIGTRASSGIGATPLEVTFNANATTALVGRLLRTVRYGTGSNNSSALVGLYTISFQLTDSEGAVSLVTTKQLEVK